MPAYLYNSRPGAEGGDVPAIGSISRLENAHIT